MSYGDICKDKCVRADPNMKCGFKIVDVDCFKECRSQSSPSYSQEPILTISQPYAMILEGPKQHAEVLLESKAGDRHCCHRWCEELHDSWLLSAHKASCKVKCNKDYPTNEELCLKFFSKSDKCLDECVSIMSNMNKLSEIEGTLYQSCPEGYQF